MSARGFGATYYVEAFNGVNKSGNGVAGQPPFRTISYAVFKAKYNGQSNDTIYVKYNPNRNYGFSSTVVTDNDDAAAGDYLSYPPYYYINGIQYLATVSDVKDGDGIVVSESDISIIGYNSQTTDLGSGIGVPLSFQAFKDHFDDNGSVLWESPRLVGTTRELSGGSGIFVTGSDVVIKNIGITNFKHGIFADNVERFVAQNVVVYDVGSINVKDDQGMGILLYSNNQSQIVNCVFVDCSYCGTRISEGRGNSVTNSRGYSRDGTTAYGSMDYYFDISNSTANTIQFCIAERHQQPKHFGHGFVVQSSDEKSCTGNTISNCVAFRLADCIYLRGAQTSGNTFVDCVIRGDSNYQSAHGNITILSGPSNNYLRRIRVFDGRYGVKFHYASGPTANNAVWASEYNIFDNCIFHKIRGTSNNPTSAVLLLQNGEGQQTHKVNGTKFVNCTFAYGDLLIQGDRLGVSNEFVNCIFKDVATYQAGQLAHGFTFSSSCLDNPSNSGFPTGTSLPSGNIEADPKFDASFTTHPHPAIGTQLNYDIKPTSPCATAGSPLGPADDFDQLNVRTSQHWGIGAQHE